jgi:hypothetical protein
MRAYLEFAEAHPRVYEAMLSLPWSTLHGLATLQAAGRLRPGQAQARLDFAHRMLTHQESH